MNIDVIQKEFRNYLKGNKGFKGTMLNSLLKAAEVHLPLLLENILNIPIKSIYNDENIKLETLLYCSHIIHLSDEILASPYGYISSQSLDLYINYYVEKHDIDIGLLITALNLDKSQVDSYFEGNSIETTGVIYERDPKARKVCIDYYGYRCSICGMNFEEVYGQIGHNFIEVHHIIPLSQRKREYQVDPIKHLRPLCSNCHSMIHRSKGEPLSIEYLKSLLKKDF